MHGMSIGRFAGDFRDRGNVLGRNLSFLFVSGQESCYGFLPLCFFM